MNQPQLFQPRGQQHIDRARLIAGQLKGIRHPAGKKYAVRLLIAELKAALR